MRCQVSGDRVCFVSGGRIIEGYASCSSGAAGEAAFGRSWQGMVSGLSVHKFLYDLGCCLLPPAATAPAARGCGVGLWGRGEILER